MLIKVGDSIKTLFLNGKVTEVIDGKEKGWRSTLYYRVQMKSKRKMQIVRHDEIQEVRNGVS